ncbi:MAG TPA: aminotransferase class V-fold PLP-dependent enzyme [Jiangellaceae bacterium]
MVDTVVQHLELEASIGGYEAADAERDRIEAIYDSAAQLLNCRREEIALTDNATRAWQAVFYALPFSPGDRIVTGRAEYCSNYMAFLQISRRHGVEITVIGDDDDGQIDVSRLAEALDSRARLVSLTHVPTSGGLVNPAADVGRVARAAGVPFLLDACQSVGQMPIDVEEIGCDFLSTAGRKFLRGPRGTGFLYVRSEYLHRLHPAIVEVGSGAWAARDRYTLKSDARRFETWEASHACQLGLGRAIDYALDLGLDAIEARVTLLARSLRTRLADIPQVAMHDLGERQCGIVTFSVAGIDAPTTKALLAQRRINVDYSTAEDTRLDFEARGLTQCVRRCTISTPRTRSTPFAARSRGSSDRRPSGSAAARCPF